MTSCVCEAKRSPRYSSSESSRRWMSTPQEPSSTRIRSARSLGVVRGCPSRIRLPPKGSGAGRLSRFRRLVTRSPSCRSKLSGILRLADTARNGQFLPFSRRRRGAPRPRRPPRAGGGSSMSSTICSTLGVVRRAQAHTAARLVVVRRSSTSGPGSAQQARLPSPVPERPTLPGPASADRRRPSRRTREIHDPVTTTRSATSRQRRDDSRLRSTGEQLQLRGNASSDRGASAVREAHALRPRSPCDAPVERHRLTQKPAENMVADPS